MASADSFQPTVLAAVISSAVVAVGWFVSWVASRQVASDRRRERVLDAKAALIAEIDCNRQRFDDVGPGGAIIEYDFEGDFARQQDRIRSGNPPAIPRYNSTTIFREILSDVSVLPNSCITQVIAYYKLEMMIETFSEDLRTKTFLEANPEKQIQMYKDYLDMLREARSRADRAIRALKQAGSGR